LSLKFLMQVIKRGKLSLFSYYCWAMGIIIILLAE
jgi:undecaprenyl pyrophosphate phosphatase UppP